MAKNLRRPLAFILAVIMVVTLIPFNTFAGKKASAKKKSKKVSVSVEYQYSDGTQAAKTYTKSFKKGKTTGNKKVSIPKKEGYTVKLQKVSGAAAKKNVKVKLDAKGTKLTYNVKKIKQNVTFKAIYTKNVTAPAATTAPKTPAVPKTPTAPATTAAPKAPTAPATTAAPAAPTEKTTEAAALDEAPSTTTEEPESTTAAMSDATVAEESTEPVEDSTVAGESVNIPETTPAELTPSADEEVISYPAYDFPTIHVNESTAVDISAEEGALPAGTEANIEVVPNEQIADKTSEVTEGDLLFALDISFWYNGQEIEPVKGKNVSVSIKSDAIAEVEDIEVVHIDDANNASLVEQDESATNEAAFTTDEFSVYAVVSTPTTIPDNRMLVIKYNDKYYAVQHDGSLMEAENYNSENNTLTFENESAARFWLLYRPGYGNNRPYQLRYRVNSSSYMYLAPNSNNGLSNSGVNLTYSGNRIYNGSSYLGVTENEDGTLSISGNNSQANAAEVYFASVEISNGQIVHHIDILIQAEADVNVSLAYGDYYDENGNKILTVTRTSGEKASASETVPINTTDIENAQITAYKSDGHGNKTNEVLDNAFNITGYQPSIGETGEQVRSNGTFLVTTSTQTGTSTNARQSRLDNRVFYTMSVVKPVEFTLKYDYDGDGDLDVLYKDDGTPITVTLYVNLSASFDYWDSRNECDGLGGNRTNWARGDIINGTNASYGSGMDFVLGSSSSDTAKVIALEITKHYVDTNGNPITVNNDQTLNFNVYTTTDDPDELIAQNIASSYSDTSATLSDYSELESEGLYSGKTLSHSDTLKVGRNTYMSLIYDYDAENGVYCIEETNPAETITDTNGKVWEYDSTKIETEYVWRNSSVSNAGKHISTGTTSIPEVAGEYTYQGNSHWGDPSVDDETTGGTLFNEFLEFDVYNIYKGDEYFYVYHSSNNKIERIPMSGDSRVTDDGFDITKEVNTGYLYGGYYHGYGGQKLTDNQIIALDYKRSGSSGGVYNTAKTDGEWDIDASGCKPYQPNDEAFETFPNTWEASKAYLSSGMTMTPVADTVYYLKEVPNTYLWPSAFKTFQSYTQILREYYLLTAVDDANYQEVGFTVAGTEDLAANIYDQIKIDYQPFITEDDDTKEVNVADVNGENANGYIAMYKYDLTVGMAAKMISQYFVTPDGVKVSGTQKRRIKVTEGSETTDGVIQTSEIKVTNYSIASTVSYTGESLTEFESMEITNPKNNTASGDNSGSGGGGDSSGDPENP